MSRRPLTVQGAVDGTLGTDDLRLTTEALVHQAALAEADGNPQLGANLRRAAELVDVPDARVIEIYEALRPSRSSARELDRIAAELDAVSAVLNAALVREAAATYARRGLLRSDG